MIEVHLLHGRLRGIVSVFLGKGDALILEILSLHVEQPPRKVNQVYPALDY